MVVLLVLLGLIAITGHSSSARGAEFEIAPGGFTARMLDAEGNPENRAGSHPDRLQIDFALVVQDTGTTARDLVFEMPPGLSGNLSAVPECTQSAYEEEEKCPPETQVGVTRFESSGGVEVKQSVFQLEPGPDQIAAFGSKPGADLPFTMELRPSDYGITIKIGDLPDSPPLKEGHFELWGVPADHQEGVAMPRRPFLTAPARCGPLTFVFRTRSWLEGAPWLSALSETAPLVGCEDLGFDPEFALHFSNPVADSPTGLQMTLSMPGEESASDLANAQMKDVTVQLPPGLTVSPAGAEGLATCSDAQFGLDSTGEALCPATSKLGTAQFVSSSLHEPMAGAVYLGEEREGERFRMFIAAHAPGLVLKFVGAFRPDPATGQLAATLQDLPAVAISSLNLEFEGGPDSLLASPLECGSATGVTRFVPYGGGSAVEATDSVAIAARVPGLQCPGPVPFAPELVVGDATRMAGRPTSLSTIVRRQSGEQLPGRFSIALPSGLSAALGNLQACSEPDADARVCPAQSGIGSVVAEVGSGPSPATLRGGVYLTAGQGRDPFGLLMLFRAAIGPFDLGAMSVRAAVQLDGRSGQVTVSTGRFPEAIEGVPIRFQTIALNMDRPGLLRSPTSCAPKQVVATTEAQGGAVATSTAPFLVTGCDKLGFRPRIRMTLTGLHKGGKPGLQTVARPRRGDSNLRAMTLSLPPAFKPDFSGLGEICSRPDALDGLCPNASRVGTAQARTPMLSKPLKGSVYVVVPKGGGQPDLRVSLEAMGVRMGLDGKTSVRHGHLITKLVGLPDLPLSSMTMRLGREGAGVFSLGAGVCAGGHPRKFVAGVSAKGQNGVERKQQLRIGVKARCARQAP